MIERIMKWLAGTPPVAPPAPPARCEDPTLNPCYLCGKCKVKPPSWACHECTVERQGYAREPE